MFLPTTIALLLCLSTTSIFAFEKCPGAANDAYEDFEWKYATAPTIAYGTVSSVNKDVVIFKVICAPKGQLTTGQTLELAQPTEAANYTECHYLTANKNYVAFVEPKTPTEKNAYKLANMEEIEVTSNLAKQYLDDQCEDSDDHGIELTVFYTNGVDKCADFKVVCNDKNRASLLDLKFAPLDSKSIILGVTRKTVPVTNGNYDYSEDDSEKVLGKKKDGGIGDERFRNNGGRLTTALMSMGMFVAGVTLLYNF